MVVRHFLRGVGTAFVLGAAALLVPAQAATAQGGPQSPLVFKDLTEHSIERITPVAGQDGSTRATVRLGERDATLVLRPHDVRTPDFQVLVAQPDGQLKRVVPPPATTFRGHVEGVDGSSVVGSIYEGSLTAEVVLGEADDQIWNIQPLAERMEGADASLHVVHTRAADLSLELAGGLCGTEDDPLAALNHLGAQGGPSGADETLALDLAVDTDFEFFQLRGSSQDSVISAVESQVNSISTIYERDVDTKIVLGEIIVRPDSSDPYTTSDGSALLSQMTNHWRTTKAGVRRDTASLMSGRNFAGGVLGVAWLSSTCTTTLGYNVNQFRSLSVGARVAVMAHEIGHNNSAPHCSGGDCRIMCAGIGGCSGDFTRFGASSQSIIRGFLDRLPCIDPLEVDPDPAPLPFNDNFDASDDLNPDLWAEATDVRVTGSVINPISEPNALSFLANGTITSQRLDVPAPGDGVTYAGFWSQHRFVESGKTLRVEFFSTFSGEWEDLGAVTSDGSTQDQFVFNEFPLPLEATGSEFRLRITAVGSDAADAWFIDSVEIDGFCRVDLNEDGQTNIFDFLEFQTLFDDASPRADFNNDTQINVFDFLEFQNQFGDGC